MQRQVLEKLMAQSRLQHETSRPGRYVILSIECDGRVLLDGQEVGPESIQLGPNPTVIDKIDDGTITVLGTLQ